MKVLFCFILILGSVVNIFAEPPKASNQSPLIFDIHQQEYTFSTVFDLRSNNAFLGSVVKSAFRIRTNYDLYDPNGKFEGLGICRILTLGVIYAWGTEIDIYDHNDNYVGMIDGQVMTGTKAKFSIYDSQKNRIAIAYLDLTCSAYTIVDPDNESHHLASLKRNFIKDMIDYWTVSVYEEDAMDALTIKVFAAFAIDSQEKFKKDN